MIRAFRYSLPLREPIRLATTRGESASIHQRQGLLIYDDQGDTTNATASSPIARSTAAWGEAAPLPGFSRESLGQLESQLSQRADATHRHDEAALPCSLNHFAAWRFAIEAAALPLPAFCKATASVPVSALLTGSPTQILAKVMSLRESACLAVKLKVGRVADLQADVALVRQVRSLLRSDQKLRLDANRAWTLEQAIAIGHALRDIDIDYLEEPVRDPLHLEPFYAATRCPYALDETLQSRPESRDWDAFPNAKAFVVKPTLLGDSQDLSRLVTSGKPIVFSAAFESGVGIAHIARLAAHFSPEIPAGLDTYDYLAEDILQTRLEFRDWSIHIPALLKVRTDRLEEIVR